jgi:multidrug efflux pump subunit AcrA (membrane-fusion protein)
VFSGQPCQVTLDAYPERRYSAYVDKIVPTADRAKATVMVKIKFKSYDERVLPEMSAKIAFLPKDAADPAGSRPMLAVPNDALAERKGRSVVYRIEDGRAVEAPVTVGRRMGGFAEIQSGLKAGEKVIARVDERIEPGSRVAVKTR